MRYLYSAVIYLLTPLMLLRLWWRGRRAPHYRRRWRERFGVFHARPGGEDNAIWIHAVSVGEVHAAVPLVTALQRVFPQRPLVITTHTPTGSLRVRELWLHEVPNGAPNDRSNEVMHVYAPWDSHRAVQRFLQRTRPALLLLMETELWPNLLHYTARRGCPILLVNARLSPRSARRYALVLPLVRAMLERINHLVCQSQSDSERFLALGIAASKVSVCGNLKFDVSVSDAQRARSAVLREDLGMGTRSVLLAASTHEGEDAVVLDAFNALRNRHPDALLVLAPRHPERCVAVADLVENRGLRVVSYSDAPSALTKQHVLLIDTLGDLFELFGLADLAIVGGSFVPAGGHNPLEAAAWSVPVVSGPSLYNFADAYNWLAAAGAAQVVTSPRELSGAVVSLFDDVGQRSRMGAAAARVMAEHAGATQRIVEHVHAHLTKL